MLTKPKEKSGRGREREGERRKTLIIEIFRIEPHLKNGLRYFLARVLKMFEIF